MFSGTAATTRQQRIWEPQQVSTIKRVGKVTGLQDIEDLGLTVASWARLIAAVDGPASRGRGRRRRHRRLGGEGVVERVHLEPDGAGPVEDPAALLAVAAARDGRDGGGEAAVSVGGGEVPRALRACRRCSRRA